ncbi:MAG: hypothetical protein HFJ37_00590 [Clostridia bacterium]|nr:hypothetical protein [Clostridia bacterium]
MGNFPFFRFPHPNYYYRYYPHDYNMNQKEVTKQELDNYEENRKVEKDTKTTPTEHRKISSKHNSFANFNFSNLFSSNLEEPILEVLGIQLYLDDIIILSLLFFLYTEGVQDEILFIALILLLLS